MNFKSRKELCEFIGGLSEFCLRNSRSVNWHTLKDYLESLVAPSRPFERGDRVEHLGLKWNIVSVYVGHESEMVTDIESDDGSMGCEIPILELTLITPASDREIKVGDTFSCSDVSNHEAGREFITSRIMDSYIDDTNNQGHGKANCTFRSRPHVKPEPTLLERVERLEKRVSGIENREHDREQLEKV